MSGSVGVPACYIDIYPFEGGVYTINGNNALLRSLSTDQNIRGNPGAFSITLAPGGPFGPNARPSWLDVLTTRSLVVIGMSRLGRAQIVMIGVVRSVSETEVWVPGQGVQRAVQVNGADFGDFFSQQNYYTQSLLNATTGSPLGVAGALTAIDNGLVAGTPDTVGEAWYNEIMAGPQSIMAATTLAYRGGRQAFYALTAAYFQPYVQAEIEIPLGDNFMSADGTWNDKFNQLFPFPWYEFFITTAPVGTFPGKLQGLPVTMDFLPAAAPAAPQVVARVNPLPRVMNVGSTKAPVFAMDYSLWDALPPPYTLDTIGGFQSSIQFDDTEVRNFYVINPMWLSNTFGHTNDNQVPFTYLFASWVDTASVHRYGYRPEISELHWFMDTNGLAAKKNAAAGNGLPAFETLVADLALKKTSHHEPTPNMARATVATNLRPDIMIGNRFAYSPFKNGEPWEFYIEGVSHQFTFGAAAKTTLSLSRGLPRAVYNDDALMVALHTGNAMRQNGAYTVGLPPGLGPPLQPLNYDNNTAVTGGLAAVFVNPQTK